MRTIVWDRDDVLNDLMGCWFRQRWLVDHPGCALRYEGLTANPPDAVLGVPRSEYLASLDRFRASGDYDAMEPLAEVRRWFQQNGQRYRHVVLTATTLTSAPAAAAWVFRHFGPWVRAFLFLPAHREAEDLPRYDSDKGQSLRWFGSADVLVDDSPANIEAARREGVAGVLVPRPWNDARGTPADALAQLDDLLASMECP